MPIPQYCPSAGELDDLDVLLAGGFAALAYTPDGGAELRVPPDVAEQAARAGGLDLVDPEGLPLARVAPVAIAAGGVVNGPVEQRGTAAYGAFRRLRLSAEQTRERHRGALSVVLTAPPSAADLVRIDAERHGRPVLFVVLTGAGTPRGVTPIGLVRAALAAAELASPADVVVVPLTAGAPARTRDAVGRFAGSEPVWLDGEGDLPAEVAAVVAADQPPPGRRGVVVFFTGLSGSGKSTLARALNDLVLERGERTVTSLDGDVVRRHLSAGLGFSRADRETNISRIGWVAAEIARHHGMAIASPIAPFDTTRKAVRAMAAEAGGAFVLVHVATPLEECERRDRKGLYAKARAGEIPDFTGISSPYEEPEDADVRVDTTGRSVAEALDDVLAVLYREGHLAAPAAPGRLDA